MKLIDEDCLDRHRTAGPCLLCGRFFPRLEAHHAFRKRGVGGGSRLDVAENLAGLCGGLDGCHAVAERFQIVNVEVRRLIARRHGCRPEEIRDWLDEILRAPKGGPVPPKPWEARNAANVTGPASHGNVSPGPVHRPGRRQGEEGLLRQADLGTRGDSRPGLAADADGWLEL